MTVPTDTSVTLYKEGVASPPLHPIDVGGWLNLGWSYEKEETPKTEPKTEPNAGTTASEEVLETAPISEPVMEEVLVEDNSAGEVVEAQTGRRRRS
jgi:hypothetical protein